MQFDIEEFSTFWGHIYFSTFLYISLHFHIYILHILGAKYRKHRIGLYRDDGLARFGYTSGPQADRILSNHPPNIIKNLPENISKRINTLSADETTFNKSKDLYNNALAESGFKCRITFQK